MNEHLTNLFNRITSPDKEVSKEAIVELAMLLEKNSVKNWSQKGDFVPPYRFVKLDKKQQRQIVEKIVELIASGLNEPSLYWALGKARADIALKPFLNVVRQFGSSFDGETQWQAICALDNYLGAGPVVYPASDWRRQELKAFPELLSLVENWNKTSVDERVSKMMKHLRVNILELLR